MRISDWSSDVCSSDLHQRRAGPDAAEAHSALHPILLEQIIERRPADPEQFRGGRDIALALRHRAADRDAVGGLARAAEMQPRLFAIFAAARARMSVVWGKRWSVRVYFGGPRILTKKKKTT